MSGKPAGPVLIGGCPRSGTTALALLLNSDPQVFISDEQDLVRFVQRLDPLLATRERRAEKSGGRMRDRSVRETASLDDFQRHTFSRTILTDIVIDVYRRLHAQARPQAGLALFGDKFPRYFDYLDTIFKLPFPVRYIHITRNPFDVVNSMLRRTEMARQGRDWWHGPSTVEEMTATWNAAFRAIRQVEARDDVLHVQYEDLIFDTGACLERLGAFLGIALVPNISLQSDPARHFDRAYLSRASIDQLRSHAAVDEYRRFLEVGRAAAISLRHLP